MIKTSKREWIAVLTTVTLLMAIFSFADLPITLTVFNADSFFARLFQIIGEMPNHLMAALSGAVLILYKGTASGIKRILQIVWGAFILLMGAFMGSAMTLKYAQVDSKVWTQVLLVAIIILALVAVSRLPVANRGKAKTMAVLGSVYFFTMLVVLNLLKFVWGRMRFQYMTNPSTEFTPWYLLNGPAAGNQFMSFPSGHAAQATAILFFVIVLVYIFPRLQSRVVMFKAVAYGWVALVAISRVIIGAHFASDVTFGFFFSWLLLQLWRKIFIKEEILT